MNLARIYDTYYARESPWAWSPTPDYDRWVYGHQHLPTTRAIQPLEPPEPEWADNWELARGLIARDGLREILSLLTPGELAAAALLADGCTMALIAELFGTSRQAIQGRINRARKRIVAQRPDLALLLAGRAHTTRTNTRR